MEHHHDRHQLAELLDLDGEVLHSYLSDVTAWVRQHADGQPRRVLDLGAGTGTGTIALARCFAGADVIAVDQSAGMLARIRSRAAGLGLAGRVATVQADLDAAWPAVEPVDVAWASNVLHELPRPGRVLADAFTALRPGGLLAVAELGGWPRFLPDDLGLGRPGLEARCRAALEEQEDGPPTTHGADWGPRLAAAGFARVARRTFAIDLRPPLRPGTGRYARAYFQHIRPALDGRLDAADLAVMDTLIDSDGPDGLLHRGDLTVRTTRTAWAGRRA
ncbi:MAG TPA: class I SAM-dependent methyltransferase [Streptosporangiaceae bacterium]|nr:class I SAM-dependent methyltransferase [Streptosporangiaceae bacterium]